MRRSAFALSIVAVLTLLLAAVPALAEKRVALVVGNAAYQNTGRLTNPYNDAEDMAAALRHVGFEVIFERDLDKRNMDLTIARFARAAREADAALFYFAGHGTQYRGSNYLMPVDAKLEDEFSLQFEMTRLDDVLSALNQSRGIKILVLDACRRNPLVDRLAVTATTRDVVSTRGLARIDATRGMVVAFSTQADQVALDGNGRNSPFTAALVQEIKTPGLEIGTLFRRVAADVNRTTNGKQLPELSVSILGEFYFTRVDSDVQAWTKVRSSTNIAMLNEFISKYSSSPLAADARERIAALDRAEASRREQQLRLERERQIQEEAARLRQELADRERQADEQAAKLRQELADRERQAQQQAEQLRRQLAERERLARERTGQEQIGAKPQQPSDRERQAEQEAARLRQELAERERLAQEEAKKLREALAERERLAREQADQLRRQLAEQERLRSMAPVAPTAPATVPPGNLKTAMLPPAAQPDGRLPLTGGALVLEVKKQLKRIGCYGGPIDEKWPNEDTTASLKKFAKQAGETIELASLTSQTLDAIRSKPEHFCPPQCSVREVERDGRCVAKTCPAGQHLRRDGRCAAAEKKTARPSSHAPGPSGKCFSFGGRRYCE